MTRSTDVICRSIKEVMTPRTVRRVLKCEVQRDRASLNRASVRHPRSPRSPSVSALFRFFKSRGIPPGESPCFPRADSSGLLGRLRSQKLAVFVAKAAYWPAVIRTLEPPHGLRLETRDLKHSRLQAVWGGTI